MNTAIELLELVHLIHHSLVDKLLEEIDGLQKGELHLVDTGVGIDLFVDEAEAKKLLERFQDLDNAIED